MVNKLICRTCLKQKLAKHCRSMSPEEENEESSNVLEMLCYCVPELDINLVVNPVICNDCIKELEIAFKFKTECLKTEEKCLKFSHLTNSKVDLNYFCKNVHRSIRKECIREPQSIQIIQVEQDEPNRDIVNTDTNVVKSNIFRGHVRFNCKTCYGCQNKLPDSCYHSKNYISPFFCHNCGKEVEDIADLRKHMMKHRKQRKCKVCNKCFRDLHHLTTHLRTHTGSRPFSCTLCTKSFREKYKLDQHVKQHKGDNTVKCKICGRVLSTTYNLKVHMKMHTKKSECELCGETFTTKTDLIKHLETDSETCGHSVKPKLKPKIKVEDTSEQIEQDFIKTEPEYLFESDIQEICKKENEDMEADEIDVMN